MSTAYTQRPEARPGYLVKITHERLNDGSLRPLFVELKEDDFMDEFGVETFDSAVQARDQELLMPKMQLDGEEATPGTAEAPPGLTEEQQAAVARAAFFAQQRAQALACIDQLRAAIENNEILGLTLLATPRQEGACIGSYWALMPGGYSTMLTVMTRLQARMALDNTMI